MSTPKRFRVVVTDFIADTLQPEIETLGDIADIVALQATSEDDLLRGTSDADALMVYHDISITENVIQQLKHCKLIVRCGVGYDNVAIESAGKRGIPVANVPDYGTEEVADSAIGLMLSLTRGTHRLNSRLRNSQGFWSYQQVQPLKRLRGQTLGIIGLGRIGTATALRAKAFGMNVLFYDPYCPGGGDKALGIQQVRELDNLLEKSNVLSLHCPLTTETKHMIDGPAIQKMPAGSFLVNTARGAIVNTDAIPDAIASGQLGGAAIDVLAQEPPDDDNRLIKAWRDPQHPTYDRVIINPHAAFYCEEGLLEMRHKGAYACHRALLGNRIPNVVNDWCLKT